MLSVVIVMAQQKKPRVAVYMTGNDPVNEIISNRLMSDLLRGGKYTPVERSAAFLQLVSKEQNYQHSGEVDDDQIAALGKHLGLEYVCVVSMVDVWQSEKYITAHIIDVNSAEVVGSCSSNGSLTNGQQMMSALDDLSRNLTKALDYSKQSSTTKVAVYVTRSGNKDVDIILADQLVAAFSQSGKYVAVERTSSFLKQLSKEVGYQQSGAVDDNDMIAELGKKFGVQYVCVAKTTSLFGVYYITARLVNVENAQVLKMYNAENKAMNNSQDVLKVTQEIANNLIGTAGGNGPSASNNNSGSYGSLNPTTLSQGYVDLGLPSGTLWKDRNEEGFYSYDEAVKRFGNKLPSKEQYEELKDKCSWTWIGNGYKVVGPNGNSIVLPAMGYRNCGKEFCSDGISGNYWTSTSAGSEDIWYLFFYPGKMKISTLHPCFSNSVRLVWD